jgi:hypothetical protein
MNHVLVHHRISESGNRRAKRKIRAIQCEPRGRTVRFVTHVFE